MSTEDLISFLIRANKRLRKLCAISIALALAAAGSSAASWIRVNDAERVTIAATKEGGAVAVANDYGKPSAGMLASEIGGHVAVFNSDGKPAASMVVKENGDGQVGAWDRYGKGRTLEPLSSEK